MRHPQAAVMRIFRTHPSIPCPEPCGRKTEKWTVAGRARRKTGTSIAASHHSASPSPAGTARVLPPRIVSSKSHAGDQPRAGRSVRVQHIIPELSAHAANASLGALQLLIHQQRLDGLCYGRWLTHPALCAGRKEAGGTEGGLVLAGRHSWQGSRCRRNDCLCRPAAVSATVSVLTTHGTRY
jgi:hypothetical protein